MNKAYQYCVRILAMRDYTSSQLREKLETRGYDEDCIELTLNKLKDHAYLNDDTAKKSFVQSQLRRGLSQTAIKMKARVKGINITNDEIQDHVPEDYNESQSIKDLIEKKIPREMPQDFDLKLKLKQRIFRMLLSRGFSFEKINTHLKDYFKN